MVGKKGNDPPDAELRRFLHHEVHALPGKHSARERDIDRRLRRALHPFIRQRHPATIIALLETRPEILTRRIADGKCLFGIHLSATQSLHEAAARGIAVEVNADPHRLDLDWRMVRRARELGVTLSIGADAHSTSGMSNVAVGLGIARKGWLEPDQILNTRDADAFLAFARARLVAAG